MNKLIISELFEKLDLFSEQCGSIDDPEEVKASLLLVNHLQNTLLFIEKQLILVPQSLNNNSEQISLTERLKKRNKWWKWVEESADYIFPEAIKGAPVRNDPHSCIAYWCDDLKKDINDISLKSIYRDERQLARWLNEYRNAVRAGYDWKKEEDPDYQFLDDYGFDWNPRENRKQTLMQTFYMFMKGAEKGQIMDVSPVTFNSRTIWKKQRIGKFYFNLKSRYQKGTLSDDLKKDFEQLRSAWEDSYNGYLLKMKEEGETK